MSRKKTQTVQPTPILLTIPQTADMLGLGITKVYELINSEGLPTVAHGCAKRVRLDALEEWVMQREREQQSA